MGRLFACLLIAVSAVLPQATFADMPTPVVVVTLEPLKPYVDDILRGVTSSVSLLKSGQDPHTAALSPSQAEALQHADIIIMPTETMAPQLMRMLAKKKKEGARIIELSSLKGADPLPYPKENPWLTAQKKVLATEDDKKDEHEHHHDADAHDAHDDAPPAAKKADKPLYDPHFWLDPIRMAAIAGPLALELSRDTPYYRATYTANASQLANHLRGEVDPAIRVILHEQKNNPPFNNKPFVPFLTYHAAYQYFVTRYKLNAAGYMLTRPEEMMGARTLHNTLKGAEDIQLRCLISEAQTSLVQHISEASGARVVVLNPERGYDAGEVPLVPWAQNDYDRMLYTVAKGFGGCL